MRGHDYNRIAIRRLKRVSVREISLVPLLFDGGYSTKFTRAPLLSTPARYYYTGAIPRSAVR